MRESPVRERVNEALDFCFSTNRFLGRKALPKELYPFLAQVLSLERKCVYGYDPLLSKEEIEGFWVKSLDFSFSTGFLFSKKKKCVDVRGMFDGEEAKRKGLYYKTL